MSDFAHNKHATWVFIAILLAITLTSAFYLVSVPRVFFDEAVSIEVARNFQLFGVLDITTAPGQFSGFPYITGSTGFPITIPLAGFFDMFGFGFSQARIYALLWFVAFFVVAWVFVKRIWNATYATSAIALLAGFASLHDSGRRVMGDVPGFALLLLGLILIFKKEKKFLGGILLGLAVATKPSVYLLIIPAIALTYLFSNWRRALHTFLPLGAGLAIPILSWIVLQFPNPLTIDTWHNAASFYQNAYGSSYSLWESVFKNIKSFTSQTTLIYFSFLAIATLWSLRAQLVKKDLLTLFFVTYGALDLVYFLKSPGTIRYLLPLQLFILILLPSTITFWIEYIQSRMPLFKKIPARYLFVALIALLSTLHVGQFLFSSSVVAKNTTHLETLETLKEYPNKTVGVISTPHIAAFVDPEYKFHYVRFTDQIVFGNHPLDLPEEKLPYLLVMPADYIEIYPLSDSQLAAMKNYERIAKNKWEIYRIF